MMDLNSTQFHLTNTWPSYDEFQKETNLTISRFIGKIYCEGVLIEINRLLTSKEYPNCDGIGHIVLIAICSAIDSLSAYASGGGNVGARFTSFIAKFFPTEYFGKEDKIYKSFRCDSVHGWNLHKSLITGIPNDSRHLSEANNVLIISLYDFYNGLTRAVQNYCEQLRANNELKKCFLKRYKEIKGI